MKRKRPNNQNKRVERVLRQLLIELIGGSGRPDLGCAANCQMLHGVAAICARNKIEFSEVSLDALRALLGGDRVLWPVGSFTSVGNTGYFTLWEHNGGPNKADDKLANQWWIMATTLASRFVREGRHYWRHFERRKRAEQRFVNRRSRRAIKLAGAKEKRS